MTSLLSAAAKGPSGPTKRVRRTPEEARATILDAADPVTVRLAAWAMMSGRTAEENFFAHRVQGLRLLADALESRTNVRREDLEFCLIASFALSVVWTVGGPALAGALGKKRPKGNDARFESRITRMIDAYLRDAVRSS